jgi:hypothetical protein
MINACLRKKKSENHAQVSSISKCRRISVPTDPVENHAQVSPNAHCSRNQFHPTGLRRRRPSPVLRSLHTPPAPPPSPAPHPHAAANPRRPASRTMGPGLARSSTNTRGQDRRLARASVQRRAALRRARLPASVCVHARSGRGRPPGGQVPGAFLPSRPPPPHGSVESRLLLRALPQETRPAAPAYLRIKTHSLMSYSFYIS